MSNSSQYSAFQLIKNAIIGYDKWPKAWTNVEPRNQYDVVVIGGGGHGLATAYYLAKEHGIRSVAVLEKGWLGGGNTGRNTTIIRSNYLQDRSAQLYEWSLKLWEDLSHELNFNVMLSQRGVLNLGHTLQEMRDIERRSSANVLNGIDSEVLTTEQVKQLEPALNTSAHSRYPILGASFQPRGGVARHDAIAWGYARASQKLGVDIIENCEVQALRVVDGAIQAVETNRGRISTGKVGIVCAGHNTMVASMAGVRLPLESKPLQALVSEPYKPRLKRVVMSSAVHGYISQSAKGELVVGAGTDAYVGYNQRGSSHTHLHTLAAICELFPAFSRARMLRQWGGIVDISPDASPIISSTPVKNLYINGGWGTGGFKATPGSGWVFAHTIAHDEPHRLNAAFSLNRFVTGSLIDEHGAAAVAH